MAKVKTPVVSPIISVILSILAASHHWLHMIILLFLGSSASMMSTMQNMLWLRRFMIVVTMATILFTVYRLLKHRCSNKAVIALNLISGLVSLGFIFYTLLTFGW
ncbi:hypothetical protein [Paenibacillus sp. NEAU-GSW1]|uniref:hypothetical protein n=1 Tax=Paenibacillus sp. NEAU-GSW1 TaxID=2682486 RepID=UPI0012E1D82D|nr:hypothetical protein [Paenibacillus sp. NEAU-GSW1]MUT67926.1 hypothetical protein [Paenibacillus sp. NEAU-GSW1]